MFLPVDIYDEKHGITSMKYALGVYIIVLTGRIIELSFVSFLKKQLKRAVYETS